MVFGAGHVNQSNPGMSLWAGETTLHYYSIGLAPLTRYFTNCRLYSVQQDRHPSTSGRRQAVRTAPGHALIRVSSVIVLDEESKRGKARRSVCGIRG